MKRTRALFFDLGGVLTTSPLLALRAHEREVGLPEGTIQHLNTLRPNENAWARMERGELEEGPFYALFEAEARAQGHVLGARALFRRLTGSVRPEMVAAVTALRDRYVVICVTNNMPLGIGPAMAADAERAAEVATALAPFHQVIESWKLGARKPEKRIYQYALELAGVAADEAVFLDDLGTNLKPAGALGMTTFKVVDPAQTLRELADHLGHDLGEAAT